MDPVRPVFPYDAFGCDEFVPTKETMGSSKETASVRVAGLLPAVTENQRDARVPIEDFNTNEDTEVQAVLSAAESENRELGE